VTFNGYILPHVHDIDDIDDSDASMSQFPGGHAKWVRSPHGPATVSG